MAASLRSAVSLATILALAIPSLAHAGELRLVFNNGRVTLMARDVPLREVLAEWERIGGARVVNRDAVSEAPITLEFVDVAETPALATVLRSAAGYLAFARSTPAGDASQFARIVIMPVASTATETMAAAAPPQSETPAAVLGQPAFELRMMPDGRVVMPVGSPEQAAGEPADSDARDTNPPQAEPFEAVPGPPRIPPELADANSSQPTAPGVQRSGNHVSSSTRATPTVGGTAAIPGMVMPGPEDVPPPYTPQTYPRQTAPPKPPGI